MLSQMVRGVVWNLFPVRYAGPQYNVVWLVIEESVGRPGLVSPLHYKRQLGGESRSSTIPKVFLTSTRVYVGTGPERCGSHSNTITKVFLTGARVHVDS